MEIGDEIMYVESFLMALALVSFMLSIKMVFKGMDIYEMGMVIRQAIVSLLNLMIFFKVLSTYIKAIIS